MNEKMEYKFEKKVDD